jgi:hypothetical protein
MTTAHEESQIQRAIVDWITVVAPDVIVFAIPNSSTRKPGGRAGNAVPGLRKGVFDLGLILPRGSGNIAGRLGGLTAYIEVKTDKGELSDDQIEFRRTLITRSVPHCIARSIDDVRAAFAAWGVTTREARNISCG